MSRLSNHDPSRLARLFSLSDDSDPSWFPEELAEIWRHQLAAPLAVDLAEGGESSVDTVARLARVSPAPLNTFGDLLAHPWPPINLLKLAKEFAKIRRTRKQAESYPPEVATALYYSMIALALWRNGEHISELPAEDLRRGFEWAIELSWIDEPTRQVLTHALGTLSTP